MTDYALTSQEAVILAIAAFAVIAIPSGYLMLHRRRVAPSYGYPSVPHGYRTAAVLLGLIPMAGILVVWFFVSAGLLGLTYEQLPPKLMGGMPWILFLLDLAALVVVMHLCLPAGYLRHLQDTSKGMHRCITTTSAARSSRKSIHGIPPISFGGNCS